MATQGIDLAPPDIGQIGGISTVGAVEGNTLVFDENLKLVPGAGGGGSGTTSHNELTNRNGDTNYLHLSQSQISTLNASVIPRVATQTAMKALTGSANDLVYCVEKQGIYSYCSNCTASPDDDLTTITGNGGNTRWEMIQKVSRTQGDTGWINRDNATLKKLSTNSIRIALSGIGAYAIRSVRKDLPVGNYDCTISGAAGVKYIGFSDLTGVLSSQDTLWDFGTQCPVSIVYWSGTEIVAAPQTEYHGIRDTVWHLYAHKHFGLQYDSGLTFTGAVQTDNNTNPTNDTCTFLWSTDGIVTDEDVSSTPGTGQWAQILGSGLTTSTAGIFNFLYYNGTNIAPVSAMADRSPFLHAGGNTLPQWNNGGALTASVDGDYVVYHYFGTPMVDGWSVFARPHNAKYSSLAAAQAASPSQLTWTSYAEIQHLYTAVWKVKTAFTNASHRAKLVSLQSFRLIPGTPASGVSASDHQALSNRTAPNVHPDTSLYGATANSFLRVSATGPIEEIELGAHIAGSTEKSTLVDADVLCLSDSEATNVLKKVSVARLKTAFAGGSQVTNANSATQSVTSTETICASLTLQPGTWDVLATVTIAPSGSYVATSQAYCGIKAGGVGAETISQDLGFLALGTAGRLGPSVTLLKRVEVAPSTTKTVIALGAAAFSAGSVSWYGCLTATKQ